jgi:predicted phage-related endonuclease
VLGAQLRCYARSVINQEWPAKQRGEELGLNTWDTDLFVTIEDADPVTPAEQDALAKWFDQRSEREQAREERALGEQGVIPAPLWFVLL